MLDALGEQKTLSEIRQMGALAAPYPFVLYSDLYDHRDFIRGQVNAGFSGLLWTPEFRQAETKVRYKPLSPDQTSFSHRTIHPLNEEYIAVTHQSFLYSPQQIPISAEFP